MRAVSFAIVMLLVVSVADAAESLREVAEDHVKISKMDLIILKRSVMLLGNNNKPNAPHFTLMMYDDAEDTIVQYYRVTASEVDAVLGGKKRSQDPYKDRFKMEELVLRNYLKIYKKDYGLEIRFSTVGGEKGFIVDKDGIRNREDAQPKNAPDKK